jgi:hypothetical protein
MNDNILTKTCNIIYKTKKRIIVDFDGTYISIKTDKKIINDAVTIEYIGNYIDNTFKVKGLY